MSSSGFHPGPFRYLDVYGADKFVERMQRLQETVGGERFQPCQMLLDFAKDPSKKFHKRWWIVKMCHLSMKCWGQSTVKTSRMVHSFYGSSYQKDVDFKMMSFVAMLT